MREGKKNRPQWVKWAWLICAVAVYCAMVLSMIPEQPPQETEPVPVPAETRPEPQPTEPTETQPLPPPWNLLLVNPWNPLPEDFSVELTERADGHAVDQRVCLHLETMMAAMEAEGLSALVCSSYRTQEKQISLYQRKVDQYLAKGYSQKDAEKAAGMWVAVPGTSEHQTGLAVDIIDTAYPYLDEKQEDTAAQKWLMANSWRYGFILRYPNEKSGITGIHYEPWHYRYVGKEAAQEIFEQGICLEEYLAVG